MFVTTLERAYVEEVNRLIRIRAIDTSKDSLGDVLTRVEQAQADAQDLRIDLEAGNSQKAVDDILLLVNDFQALNAAVNASLASFESVESITDEDTGSSIDNMLNAEQIVLELEDFDPDQPEYSAEIVKVKSLENELSRVQNFLEEFIGIDSSGIGPAVCRKNRDHYST